MWTDGSKRKFLVPFSSLQFILSDKKKLSATDPSWYDGLRCNFQTTSFRLVGRIAEFLYLLRTQFIIYKLQCNCFVYKFIFIPFLASHDPTSIPLLTFRNDDVEARGYSRNAQILPDWNKILQAQSRRGRKVVDRIPGNWKVGGRKWILSHVISRSRNSFNSSLSTEIDYEVGPRLREISVWPCLAVA